MNKKIFLNLLVVILLIIGVVVGIYAVKRMTNYLSRAQIGVGQPQNVLVRVIDPNQVVISWTTSQEVISLILYGTSPTALDNTQTELSSVKTHRITITDLKPGTNYFFKIQVGKEIFDNKGQPWRFKTSSDGKQPSLEMSDFQKAYGTNDPKFDLNKDGIVNGFDYQIYLNSQKESSSNPE